ncbi:hypothetical protein I302_100847 [Kwoniella bestiolae CBS 10118]|uniref:MARVEL domain-containing protein n=1 Tax=Kwoniella bestiolae CBS 10118 TaxID=1296100 RepID=A0A1B9G669_9TREE|nr:hypothetical protein I302_04220 [Kwoniella bestiolae CBS 10118]OCF26534.1 hypothetical protein I302_04220 [Kwoniella bestiolae CBS 10118]
MSFLPLLTTSLKGFAAFWSLILFAVSASFISKSNSYFGSGPVNASNFAAGNALIAGGLLFLIYLCVALFFIFRIPDHILISVMVDTIMLGIFFIYFLASTAALSTEASFFSRWDDSDTWAALGNAVVGLGWVMTFLVLGILLLEVIITLKHHGGTYPVWRTPFNQLVSYGAPGSSTNAGAGVSSGVPMTSTGTTNQHTYQSNAQQAYAAPPPATQATGEPESEPHHIITPFAHQGEQRQQVNEKLSPYQGQLPPGAAA